MSLTAIARSLGLSVTTVSRALGGFSDVAAATRMRVEAEAERIGYHPHAAARRLRSGRSEAVGVVLPSGPGQFDDPFFLRLLGGIGAGLATHGFDLIVTAARPGAAEMAAYRHLAEGRRVDGFIVARTRQHDARIGWLLDRGMPFVAHGRTMEPRSYAHLDIDGEAAFAAATRRLIGFGHRRIGLINAPGELMFSHHRAAGWCAALAEAGLPPGPSAEGEATEETGMHLATRLLRAAEPPTALLCATDRLAAGALHAIGFAGLRAGQDISVIGYDNLPLSTYTDPPLTTIEQPIDRAAERLVQILMALLGGASPAGFADLWPARLVPRASDGPAPARSNRPRTGWTLQRPNRPSRGGHDVTGSNKT